MKADHSTGALAPDGVAGDDHRNPPSGREATPTAGAAIAAAPRGGGARGGRPGSDREAAPGPTGGR